MFCFRLYFILLHFTSQCKSACILSLRILLHSASLTNSFNFRPSSCFSMGIRSSIGMNELWPAYLILFRPYFILFHCTSLCTSASIAVLRMLLHSASMPNSSNFRPPSLFSISLRSRMECSNCGIDRTRAAIWSASHSTAKRRGPLPTTMAQWLSVGGVSDDRHIAECGQKGFGGCALDASHVALQRQTLMQCFSGGAS